MNAIELTQRINKTTEGMSGQRARNHAYLLAHWLKALTKNDLALTASGSRATLYHRRRELRAVGVEVKTAEDLAGIAEALAVEATDRPALLRLAWALGDQRFGRASGWPNAEKNLGALVSEAVALLAPRGAD
jgi:hypothetical protein